MLCILGMHFLAFNLKGFTVSIVLCICRKAFGICHYHLKTCYCCGNCGNFGSSFLSLWFNDRKFI